MEVLIGTPVYSGSKPFLDKFLENVKKQNADLILADNSEDDEVFNFLKEKKLNVVKVGNKGNKYDNVFYSRKSIVNEFLKGNYDYLFWVDSDIIIPEHALNKLRSWDKEIISGLYFSPFKYKDVKTILPVAYKFGPKEDLRKPLQIPELKKNSVMEVHSVGFGCCLIKRKVIEKVPLRRIENTPSTEDVLFCFDARKNGYKTFLDTSVLCKHGIKRKERIFWLYPKNAFSSWSDTSSVL